MEVYFIDIGRGTSNLVLLGDGRAIIVDCGQNSGVLLQLLAQFRIETIVRLIISHNHQDHAGGALSVLTQYEGKIEKICFVHDTVLMGSRFGDKINQQIKDGTLTMDNLVRIECEEKPKYVYGNKGDVTTLRAFSPRFADNLQAIKEGDPNATSGVLVLDNRGKRIVFAGDSTIRQWRRIREARGSPLECDVLAVPHHAGIVWDDASELTWLYEEGLRPKHAVISVATINKDKHPRKQVIDAIIRSGGAVACTQITDRCCSRLEDLRPGVLKPLLPGRSRPTPSMTSSGRSRSVACAGTVLAEIKDGVLEIHRLKEHGVAVSRLAADESGHPMCRERSAPLV